jgi:histidinol-phosphatase (PHP family)
MGNAEKRAVLPSDYHIHTPLCQHAEGTIPAYVSSALKIGIQSVIFTDHAPAPDGYDPLNRMPMGLYPEYLKFLSFAQKQNDFLIGIGIEADFYPGGLDFLQKWLPEQPFDVVLGSVHYLKNWAFDNPTEMHIWNQVNVDEVWQAYFQEIGKLAETGMFDVVSHLDLPKKFGYKPSKKALQDITAPAMDKIAKAGMAIEINTSGLRRPVKEMYPSFQLLCMAKERGIPIVFGSDAHTPKEVGFCFKEAVELAKEAGYSTALKFSKRKKTSYLLPP